MLRNSRAIGATSRPILDLLNRWSAPVGFATAAMTFSGCAEYLAELAEDPTETALTQQQQGGWSVGGENQPLLFTGAQELDAARSAAWREAMTTLSLRLTPTGARWAPYYNPTLFQSLEAPRNYDLRAAMRPIFTAEMARAVRRGNALLALLKENGACHGEVAVVLDLAGPESVAVAAALSPCFDPVFVFANWPHPLGVVPAHHTLGAALYYLPTFAYQRGGRAQGAAPVFVLDRSRLAPYVDESGHFDNRYFAGLPPIAELRAAGVQHLLYVTPDDHVILETDDLNDDLVTIDQGGIDVKMLALSDFAEAPLPDWPATAGCLPLPPAVVVPPAPASAPQLFFGGSPEAQSCFSFWYGWRRDRDAPVSAIPQPGVPSNHALSALHVSFPVPPRLAPRCQFRPAPRSTFAIVGHGGGSGSGWRGRAASFGHPGGGGFSRSGSLGRVHFTGFG